MSTVLPKMLDLKCLIKNIDIRLCSCTESGVKQLLVLVTSDGDLVFHYSYGELPPIVKHVSWFTDSGKEVQAICFDPTATWLLAASLDGSLYIIPALSLVDKKQKIDCKWSISDLTHFAKHSLTPESKPNSIVWWQTFDCNQNALVGYENGAISLISLTDGRCLGTCNISEAVTRLFLCQDNSLDCVSLLINGESGQQWRLLLEQHSTGYVWPPESNVIPSDTSAASRLQSFKQMSVDKFVSFKLRLSEARAPRRDSQTSDTTSDSSHSENSPVGPELLPHLCDTFFSPQNAKNRYLFSAFYKPTSLLTVHAADAESAPLYVHKLPPKLNYLILTDRFIYAVNEDNDTLEVVSTQLSECRLEGDTEFNTEAHVSNFHFDHETILNVYKVNGDLPYKDKKHREEIKKDRENKIYKLPRNVKELHLRKPKIDTCVIVTNKAVYKVVLSCSPVTKFVDLIIEDCNIEVAEKLSLIFGLNLQDLMEKCGDILIANGSYHLGLVLYKQAKVHLLKRVLKLAVSGDCRALLKFVHLCLSVSKIDMSTATKIHMGNLAVMAYTELILRHGGHLRLANTKDFINFLRYEEFYDQVLAVNVACQAGHWKIVSVLAQSRGLQPEIVAAISQVLQAYNSPHLNNQDFLLAVSEESLTQSLLVCSTFCQVILNYIRTHIDTFPTDVLYRLAIQLDPSQPCALPIVTRIFQKLKSNVILESTDSVELEISDQSTLAVEQFIETFLCVLLRYLYKSNNNDYDMELLERIVPPYNAVKEKLYISKFPEIHPLSCGYEHAAVIRNGQVYTMGVANSGCLGLGPLLTQSSPPKVVQTLCDLKVKALSVSCGRKHTLVLTDFGIYSWGSNTFGQLGLGCEVQESPYPQNVSTLCNHLIVDVVAGQYHSMALTASGEVFTWGWGIHGQLGHSNCDNIYLPKILDFQQRVMQISAGHAHSLILTEDGKLYGFGSNAFGQLEGSSLDGNKTTLPVRIYISPDIYTPIEKIATAYFHNIAVRADHEVYTWGANPQEVRLCQSKYNQKLNGIGLKSHEPWKTITRIYTSTNKKAIGPIAVGFRHTAVLHNGKLLLRKNMEEDLTVLKFNEHENIGIISQRFLHVACGPDYTIAMDHTGKLLAWGNSSIAQTLLGKPSDDDQRRIDGRVVVFKNTKRIIKIPNNFQTNSETTPVEVPGLPTMAITFNAPNYNSLLTRNCTAYTIRCIDNDEYIDEQSLLPKRDNSLIKISQKTLHYVLETYFGYYDTELILSKCLQVQNFQAASKISILDGHYTDSLSYQLGGFKKFLDSVKLNFGTNLKSSDLCESGKMHLKEDSQKSDSGNKPDIRHPNSLDPASNSPARILSASSSLDSIEQWNDDLENQGGRESPCDPSEVEGIRQTMVQYMQSFTNENSPPISCVSKLLASNTHKYADMKPNKDVDLCSHIEDVQTRQAVKTASHLIEFYIERTYISENHILMQNILLKGIEFWLSNNLPVPILENILLKNMDKYFYPLSILLFCKNFNNNLGEELVKKDDKQQKSVGFLKEFSTKFCLQLCSMVLENVNKS